MLKEVWVPRVRVIFFNNSIEFLNKIQRILGINKNFVKKYNKKNKNINYELRLSPNELRLSPNEMRELLPQLRLVIKEKKRILVLKLLNEQKGNRNQNTNNNKHEYKLEELVCEWNTI